MPPSGGGRGRRGQPLREQPRPADRLPCRSGTGPLSGRLPTAPGESRCAHREGALYRGAVTTHVIVLNGGSSSGTSELTRCLQATLPEPWLALGVDNLIEAMPASLRNGDTGIGFAADGGVSVGPQFRELEAAWMAGVAAMAGAGARIVVDEVFLGGGASQRRWQHALRGLEVLWIGVRCESAVAAAREQVRGDRVRGMAASQAELVHQGVHYDLQVDTTRTPSAECARTIAAHVHH